MKVEIEANPDLIDTDGRHEDQKWFGSHRPPGCPEKPLVSAWSARTANRHR